MDRRLGETKNRWTQVAEDVNAVAKVPPGKNRLTSNLARSRSKVLLDRYGAIINSARSDEFHSGAEFIPNAVQAEIQTFYARYVIKKEGKISFFTIAIPF